MSGNCCSPCNSHSLYDHYTESTRCQTRFLLPGRSIGAFKVITDGSSSGPTPATRDPYTSNGQDCGILYWDQDGLDMLLGRVHRQGFQCTVHAIGGRTIEQTLHAMGRAQREFPRAGLRHRIEHCANCPHDLCDRVRA